MEDSTFLLTDKFLQDDSLHRVLQGNMRVLTMFSDGTVSGHNLLDTVRVAWHSPDCTGGPLSPLLNLALQCKNIRWIETRASGSDNPLLQAMMQRGIAVSTCPGASAIPVAQGVVAGMLTLARQAIDAELVARLARFGNQKETPLPGEDILTLRNLSRFRD